MYRIHYKSPILAILASWSRYMKTNSAIVIGSGAGGLTSALRLLANGWQVTVLERAERPGGKVRTVSQEAGRRIDAGPTVFTMRWVFEQLFTELGERLEDHIKLERASILARHAWMDGSRLDLYADLDKSAEAIAEFAGHQEANGYRKFCAETAEMFAMLKEPFLCAPEPSLGNLIRVFGLGPIGAIKKIQPLTTMAKGITQYFNDKRLQQLFGRYATYCGSSPYLAPATLMLIAHVEQDGVWYVKNGMYSLIEALVSIAESRGGDFKYNSHVDKLLVSNGKVTGIVLASGEELLADAVVMNGDCNALASGLLGDTARRSVAGTPPLSRSLSAMTWMLDAETTGFPLVRHNVFFSNNYPAEFTDLVEKQRLPREPTVYICAQDRRDDSDFVGRERMLIIVNAPANGQLQPLNRAEYTACEDSMHKVLSASGLSLNLSNAYIDRCNPHDFSAMFPATHGALYGRASHGWQASLSRPGCRSKLRGLYLAGGSVHPGAGVPMAGLSGIMAAECVIKDTP